VPRYVAAAEITGLAVGAGALTEQVGAVVLALQPSVERSHGDGWKTCESERVEIEVDIGWMTMLEPDERGHRHKALLHDRRVTLGRHRSFHMANEAKSVLQLRQSLRFRRASRARLVTQS